MTTTLRIFAEYIHPDQEVELVSSDGVSLGRLTKAFEVKSVSIWQGCDLVAREVAAPVADAPA